MGFVRSYYRRSAGSELAAAKTRHNLRVVVYDGVASTTPVRFRGPHTLRDLAFSTQLPGGFGQCSFVMTGAAARQWQIDTGHKVIVWDGRQIAWMGWIEDVKRARDLVQVLALGPYEELQQRSISETWTETTEQIVKEALDACSYVSANRSHVDRTGIALTSYTVARATCAAVIDACCTAGDDQQRQMLFALWEPGPSAEVTTSANIMWDGDAEKGSAYGFNSRSNTHVYSGAQAAYGKTWTAGPIDHPYSSGWMDARHSASPSSIYRISGWIYTDTDLAANTMDVDIEWYSAVKGLLATSTLTLTAATLPEDTWTYFSFIATSHANTAYFKFGVPLIVGWFGGVWVDAVSVALQNVVDVYDRMAVPYFWARDLTDYEYLLRGAGTEWQETTRTLANYVIVTYGSSSATAAAEDGTSQATYRRRDAVVAAGSSATQALAEAQRDAYLAAHKETATELASSSWSYERITGELTDARGRPVELARVRAGERIRIVDGEYAGSVVLIHSTEWRNGQLTITPERYAAVAELLARSV